MRTRSRARPRPRRAAFGGIDALVCSAGITGPNVPLADYPVDAWKQVFDVNVHGVFLCNRAVVPVMQKKDYGRIVNIASVAGKEGNPNASAYSASKAAVIGLTKSLGKELAKTGIRANCVTPAAVRTAIFDQMSQQHIDFMLSKIPLGPLRHRRRNRGDGVLARERGLLVLDRRGVRPLGRPRDVLGIEAKQGAEDATGVALRGDFRITLPISRPDSISACASRRLRERQRFLDHDLQAPSARRAATPCRATSSRAPPCAPAGSPAASSR